MERLIDKLDMKESLQVAKDAGFHCDVQQGVLFARGRLYQHQQTAGVRKALLKLCVEKLS